MTTTEISPACAAPALEDCNVVELRDYTLFPGQRDTLVELFEREFVETQEACGMRVMAQFRDLDEADRFVWLRGCADMASRRRGLEAFYGGPVWQRHRDAANATMVDSDNVRLLRPAKPAWAPTTPLAPRARHAADRDDGDEPSSLYVLAVALQRTPFDGAMLRLFERDVLPAWRDAGAPPCAVFTTEPSSNDYPRLPVRTDGHVLAWLARLRDAAAWQAASRRLADLPAWASHALPALQRGALQPLALRRLQPTRRSLLR